MTKHNLKTWPVYFERLLSGEKTFEVRKDDRGFQPGDVLNLREYDPERCPSPHRKGRHCPGYTGRSTVYKVGFIYGAAPGVDPDYVVMSLLPLLSSIGKQPGGLLEGEAS